MKQQDLAVASGHWPLIRFNPELRSVSANPFQLDSPRPTIKLKEYAYNEMRYKSLAAMRPQEAAALAEMAQTVAAERYRSYEELAQRDGSRFHPAAEAVAQELAVGLPDSGNGLQTS
jgi:pyruvate-ferredoxin/flavodoxin oxidoreductase